MGDSALSVSDADPSALIGGTRLALLSDPAALLPDPARVGGVGWILVFMPVRVGSGVDCERGRSPSSVQELTCTGGGRAKSSLARRESFADGRRCRRRQSKSATAPVAKAAAATTRGVIEVVIGGARCEV